VRVDSSALIGPTCRQAMENRDGSPARPMLPLSPPVRGLAHMAGHARHLGVVERADADAVVLADEAERVLTQDRSSAMAALPTGISTSAAAAKIHLAFMWVLHAAG
jgi:hypothetical protein